MDIALVTASARQRLIDLARNGLGMELESDPTVDTGLAFLWTPERRTWPEISIVRMIFNWRVQTCEGRYFYGRHWCYQGIYPNTFLSAVAAVKEWRGNPNSEPTGWIKSWDGRTPDG